MFQPGAEVRGALGSVPIVISFYITLSASFPVFSLPSPPPPPLPSAASLYVQYYLSLTPFPSMPDLPSYPTLCLGICLPYNTTVVIPVLLSADPLPDIAPVSDEL